MPGIKYIVHKDLNHIEKPVLFSELDTHLKMVKGLDSAVSAGFVEFGPGAEVRCFGEAITLGLESRPERDEALIQWAFCKQDYPIS